MDHIGYKLRLADPEFWVKTSRLDNGTDCIEYVLLYIDDCLVVSQHPMEVLMRSGR